jgi:hypothetical protein
MQWLRRKLAPTSGELLTKFTDLLDNSAINLFNSTVLIASELQSQSASQIDNPELSNEKAWTVQIELLWFLIAALCRDMFAVPGSQPEDRDVIQDGILHSVINHMVERMFNSATMTPEKRSEQASRFLNWYNESEMYYGYITEVTPSLDHLTLDDSLAGKAATRIATAVGEGDNIGLKVSLLTPMMKTYIAVNIPSMATDLVKTYQAFRARS